MSADSSYNWPLLWCAAALGLPLLIAADFSFSPVHWVPFAALLYLNAENRPGRAIALPLVMVLLAALDLTRLTGLWPCDIGCQGGAYYQTIANVSVLWPALITHLALAMLALRDLRRGALCPWTVRLGWFLGGVSCFFVLIAYQFNLHCPYCRAVHWGTIAAILCLAPLPAAMRWWQAVAWCIAGVLVTNAVFHHAPVADVSTPATTITTVHIETASSSAADHGRTYGDAASQRTLEVVIDLTCGHCADQYRPLMEALKPILAAKRVRVIVRHFARPSQAASRPAAELALAAAALQEHAAALEILLPSNPDAGFAGLKARLTEVIDPVKLDQLLAKDHAAITALLNDDQQRISQLGVGLRTPSAVLIEDGKVVKTWSGELPVPAIVAALDGAL